MTTPSLLHGNRTDQTATPAPIALVRNSPSRLVPAEDVKPVALQHKAQALNHTLATVTKVVSVQLAALDITTSLHLRIKPSLPSRPFKIQYRGQHTTISLDLDSLETAQYDPDAQDALIASIVLAIGRQLLPVGMSHKQHLLVAEAGFSLLAGLIWFIVTALSHPDLFSLFILVGTALVAAGCLAKATCSEFADKRFAQQLLDRLGETSALRLCAHDSQYTTLLEEITNTHQQVQLAKEANLLAQYIDQVDA